MQAEDQQSWRIEVRAKAKNFDFKFKAAKTQPNWKIQRLSVLLKIRSFFIKVKSESADSIPSQTRRTIIPKFLRTGPKMYSTWTTKSGNRQKPEAKLALSRFQRYAKEEPISFGSLLVMILGLAFQKGVVMLISGLVFLLHIALVTKRVEARKLLRLLVFASVLACSVVLDLSSYKRFAEPLYPSSKFVWKPWKIVGSLIWNSF